MMRRFFQPVPAGRRLIRTRPGLPAAALWFSAACAALMVAGLGLMAAGVSVRRLLPADAGGVAGVTGPGADAGAAWFGLAAGLALAVFAAGTARALAAAASPLEVTLDEDGTALRLRRGVFGTRRIPRSAVRHVELSGRRTRSGRGLLIVRLVTRRRRVALVVDAAADWDRLLPRVRQIADDLAEVLDCPCVTTGWASDPGVAGSRGIGRGPGPGRTASNRRDPRSRAID